jgi:hypothetical protein
MRQAMHVVILAGGFGMRLTEETIVRSIDLAPETQGRASR